jgi:hypothetical protein
MAMVDGEPSLSLELTHLVHAGQDRALVPPRPQESSHSLKTMRSPLTQRLSAKKQLALRRWVVDAEAAFTCKDSFLSPSGSCEPSTHQCEPNGAPLVSRRSLTLTR